MGNGSADVRTKGLRALDETEPRKQPVRLEAKRGRRVAMPATFTRFPCHVTTMDEIGRRQTDVESECSSMIRTCVSTSDATSLLARFKLGLPDRFSGLTHASLSLVIVKNSGQRDVAIDRCLDVSADFLQRPGIELRFATMRLQLIPLPEHGEQPRDLLVAFE